MTKSAATPTKDGGKQYHLLTKPGDIAEKCILVGAQGRVTLIANNYLEQVTFVENEYRGLRTATGFYRGHRISIVSTGMGPASLGIIVGEAFICGARLFIRVGTCGSLVASSSCDDIIIVNAAYPYEGAYRNWLPKHPPHLPIPATELVVKNLEAAASLHAKEKFWVGTEGTTECFRDGQGRPNILGQRTDESLRLWKDFLSKKISCLSMEASTLFAWCIAHGNIHCGLVNAIIGNRITDEWSPKPETELRAAKVALEGAINCDLK